MAQTPEKKFEYVVMSLLPEPKPKEDIVILKTDPQHKSIEFATSEKLRPIFEKFGTVHPYLSELNHYWMYVDRRYDFGEVIAYLKNLRVFSV